MPRIDKQLLSNAETKDADYLNNQPDLWMVCITHIDEEIELAITDKVLKTVDAFLEWQCHLND